MILYVKSGDLSISVRRRSGMMLLCGGWDEVAFAKLKVNKLASDISWSFWALQQRINSDVNYDYMNWYCQKTARLQHAWADPRVDIWFNLLKGVSPYYTK